MEPLHYLQKLVPQSRRAYRLAVAVALCVLAGTVFGGWFTMRWLIREQIAHRDAEALGAVTQAELMAARAAETETIAGTDEEIGFEAAVRASRLRGVMGIRFFDASGQFKDAFPATINPVKLDDAPLRAVRQFRSHTHFRPDTSLRDIFIYLPSFSTGQVARVPILEVTVPLRSRDEQRLTGIAQFVVEGASIAAEYKRLERTLGLQSLAAFLVAGGVLALLLWPAFRQVQRLNLLLSERNERLLRANQELALAARTSAVGAVSAHLMHGLKNPLASLSEFVQGRSPDTVLTVDDWQDALTAARRMQSLVEHTLEVLAEAEGGPAYELTFQELASSVHERVRSLAASRQVEVRASVATGEMLSSRVGNLVSLILVNLLENAAQVTPAGRRISLEIIGDADRVLCRVRDEGPGFPPPLRHTLFLPCKSTREGGSGIGLAISKQLANHLGASLDLEVSEPSGCVFLLGLPRAILRDAPRGIAQPK